MTVLDLRVATLNVAGGEKTFEQVSNDSKQSRLEALERLIRHLNADLLCLQEVSQYVDAQGVMHCLRDKINQDCDFRSCYYGKTLTMKMHQQVKNPAMDDGVFKDWLDWSKGNAVHSRYAFSSLDDPKVAGEPQNIPLYQPVTYEGNRDTESRFAILSRLNVAPFPFSATLHLTTLVGERQPEAPQSRVKQAQRLRAQQIGKFLELVRKPVLEEKQPMILAGDFNAEKHEDCIQQLLEAGFIRLKPKNTGPSHGGSGRMIDHILFFPREGLVDYECYIEDSDLSKRASDHLAVVADLRIK